MGDYVGVFQHVQIPPSCGALITALKGDKTSVFAGVVFPKVDLIIFKKVGQFPPVRRLPFFWRFWESEFIIQQLGEFLLF